MCIKDFETMLDDLKNDNESFVWCIDLENDYLWSILNFPMYSDCEMLNFMADKPDMITFYVKNDEVIGLFAGSVVKAIGEFMRDKELPDLLIADIMTYAMSKSPLKVTSKNQVYKEALKKLITKLFESCKKREKLERKIKEVEENIKIGSIFTITL